MLFFLKESPRYHLLRNNFEEAFEILELMRKESRMNHNKNEGNVTYANYLDSVEHDSLFEGQNNSKLKSNQSYKLDEHTKMELKYFYSRKKNNSMESGYSSTIVPKYKIMSIKIWILWFVVSYIFYGVLYLIPELVGKQKEHVNFTDLINAVVFSTFFEIIGILSTFMIECESIGRIGGFKISFILCVILSSICMLKFKGWILSLHVLKGAIQIPTRALYVYTSECYPTEIRGIALGLGNSFTRLAGLLTPIINEVLLSYSPNACFVGISTASLLATLISFNLQNETLNRKIE